MSDSFTFRTKRLSVFDLESRICAFCGMDYADSSDIPALFHECRSMNVQLHSVHTRPHKHIKCNILVSHIPESDEYEISVYGITSM